MAEWRTRRSTGRKGGHRDTAATRLAGHGVRRRKSPRSAQVSAREGSEAFVRSGKRTQAALAPAHGGLKARRREPADGTVGHLRRLTADRVIAGWRGRTRSDRRDRHAGGRPELTAARDRARAGLRVEEGGGWKEEGKGKTRGKRKLRKEIRGAAHEAEHKKMTEEEKGGGERKRQEGSSKMEED